jgi:hypothetical protein
MMLERLDYEAVERVEAELDAFILKRSREKREANEIAELWKASEERDRERRRQANREAWVRFHQHLQALHQSLADDHAQSARALSEGRG